MMQYHSWIGLRDIFEEKSCFPWAIETFQFFYSTTISFYFDSLCADSKGLNHAA